MFMPSRRNDITIIDRIFILSIMLGSSASYSIVYLFHIILTIKVTRTLLSLFSSSHFYIKRAIRWDAAFFVFFLGWYILSSAWAQDTGGALLYCIYIIFAILIIYYITKICYNIISLYKTIYFIIIISSIQIFLSLLESLRLIRLPFSPYSPYIVYFGHKIGYNYTSSSDKFLDYISDSPTGFFGNPNDLSCFLVLIFPLFIFSKNKILKILGIPSIFFVIFMTGSRTGLIVYVAAIIVATLCYGGRLGRVAVALALLFVGILGTNLVDLMKHSENQRIEEVGTTGVAVRDMLIEFLHGKPQSSDSVGKRVQLMLNGFEALQESSGLGVGAGGSRTVQESSESKTIGDVRSMHNFWIELLVDGGVFFAFIFAIWYLSLLWRLWRVGAYSSVPMLRYCGRALFVGFVCFIPGAIGPSSVIYMLQMWMLVGVALSVVSLESQQRRARRVHASASPPFLAASNIHPQSANDGGAPA